MARGIFYILDGLEPDQQLRFYCERITQAWRDHRSVRVWCADKTQALAIDEALWQQPVDAFVPHNLVGEGPPGGAPVEICWPDVDDLKPRRVGAHVNLADTLPPMVQGAAMLIDRVPAEEAGKAIARERYKAYRTQGVQLSTAPAELNSIETNDAN